jgi:hypothetical protein
MFYLTELVVDEGDGGLKRAPHLGERWLVEVAFLRDGHFHVLVKVAEWPARDEEEIDSTEASAAEKRREEQRIGRWLRGRQTVASKPLARDYRENRGWTRTPRELGSAERIAAESQKTHLAGRSALRQGPCTRTSAPQSRQYK